MLIGMRKVLGSLEFKISANCCSEMSSGGGMSSVWHMLIKNFSLVFDLKHFTQIPGKVDSVSC